MFDRLPICARRYEAPGLHGFGDKRQWDDLRSAMPGSRDEWEARCTWDDIVQRAEDAATIINGLSAAVVASHGVGEAAFELHLARQLNCPLICTEYAPSTVERLRLLMPEASHVVHDLTTDPPIEADLHVLHRVDTEFDQRTFRSVIGRLGSVLLIAAEDRLTPRRLIRHQWCRHRGGVQVSWERTTKALESAWSRTHEAQPVRVGTHAGWLLRSLG